MKHFVARKSECEKYLIWHYLENDHYPEAYDELKDWLCEHSKLPVELLFPSDLEANEQVMAFCEALAERFVTLNRASFFKIEGFKQTPFYQAQLTLYNQMFADIIKSNKRNLNGKLAAFEPDELLQQIEANKKQSEIRYAKLQLIKNEPIKASIQREHQQSQQQEVQSEQQQQTQSVQQQQKEQSQLRQQQMEQRQERIRPYNKPHPPIDVAALGKLITFNELKAFAEETGHDYLSVLSVWEAAVGPIDIAQSIHDVRNKVTHVSQAAFEEIMAFAHEFSYGLLLENLPNGFAIHFNLAEKQSILYFDENLKKKPEDPDYRANPLTIQLLPEPAPPDLEGSSGGQFFNFSLSAQNLKTAYPLFKLQVDSDFNTLFGRGEKKDKIPALLRLAETAARADSIELADNGVLKTLSQIVHDFSLPELDAFRWIITQKGCAGILLWIDFQQKLHLNGFYESFHRVFLSSANDYSHFLDEEHQAAINELIQLDSWQKSWWLALTNQHKGHAKFLSLWKGFDFFIKEVKSLAIELPALCPVQNGKHMLVTMDRLLFILNHALDVEEQKEHLHLDYSHFGAVCASRTDGYYLVTADMKLTRHSLSTTVATLYQNGTYVKEVDHFYSQYINKMVCARSGEKERKDVLHHFLENRKEAIAQGFYGPVSDIIEHAVVFSPRGYVRKVSYLCAKTVDLFISRDDKFLSRSINKFQDDDKKIDWQELSAPAVEELKAINEKKLFFILLIQNTDTGIGLYFEQVRLFDSVDKPPCFLVKQFPSIDRQTVETDFQINFEQLVERCEKEPEPSAYFFRYLGRQKDTFPYQDYVKLNELLSQFLCSSLLIPLVACATNQRALESHDIVEDFKEISSFDYRFFENLYALLPLLDLQPSLKDLRPVLRYFGAADFDAPENVLNPALQGKNILSVANQAGCLEFLYDFLLNLDEREPFHPANSECIRKALNQSYSLFQENSFNSLHQKVFRRLLILCKEDEWPILITHLASLKQVDAVKLDLIDELLKNVNFAASTLASAEAIQNLSIELQNLEDSPKLKLDMEGAIRRLLPSIHCQPIEFSEQMGLLIGYIKRFQGDFKSTRQAMDDGYKQITAQFVSGAYDKEINDLLHAGMNDFSGAKSFLPDIPGLSTAANVLKGSLTAYLTKKKKRLISWMDAFKKAADTRFDGLEAALENNDVKALFDEIDQLLELLKNPISVIRKKEKLDLKEKALFFVLEKILKKSSEKMMQSVETQLAQHINPIIDGMLTSEVGKLWSGNKTANRQDLKTFKQKMLIFYKTQISSIHSESLTQRVNQQLKDAEDVRSFVRVLNKLSDAAVPLLIHELEQYSYFDMDATPSLNLEKIEKILRSLVLLKSVDQGFLINKLLNNLTEKNYASRLEALNALEEANQQGATYQVFNSLFELGLAKKTIEIRDQLLRLYKTRQFENSLFQKLIEHASIEVLSRVESWFAQSKPYFLVENLVKNFPDNKTDSNIFLNLLNAYDACPTEVLLPISLIIGRMNQQKVSAARQIALIQALKTLPESSLVSLAALYEAYPHPDYEKLQSVLANKEGMDSFCQQVNIDPFGRREKVNYTYSFQEIMDYTQEIVDLRCNEKLSHEKQRLLFQQFAYIMMISDQYSVPLVRADRIDWKPFKEFTRQDLILYAKQLRLQFSKARDDQVHSLYLEAIALASEVLFKTQGKYPAPNQLLSVLAGLNHPGSLAQQIDPGQGKTIIIAVNAFLQFFTGHYVNISSRDKTLVSRDFSDFQSFFSYLGIPTGLIDAHTEKNIYSPEHRQISYGTPDDFVHYYSAQRLLKPASFQLPPKNKLILLCDEFDSLLLDYQARLNFSVSHSDPYANPYQGIYPLINAFVNSEHFIHPGRPQALQPGKQEDLTNLRRSLAQNYLNYNHLKEELTDALLDQWLNSACSARQLRQDVHFVVDTINRCEYGVNKSRSVAKILSGGDTDDAASWSDGVHQLLHARLNDIYKNEINEGVRPAFSCDSESEILDSRTIGDFFKFHGVVHLYSGTPGSKLELDEIAEQYDCKILKLPRRCPNALTPLSPILTDNKSYYKTIMAQINHHRDVQLVEGVEVRQPVLLFVNEIADAEAMYQELKTQCVNMEVINLHHPNRTVSYSPLTGQEKDLRAVHGGKVFAKEAVINAAGNKNTLTLTTGDQLGIGTDIESSNLFVIIADFFRKRKIKQYQNRTARGDKKGMTVSILNMEKIGQKYHLKVDLNAPKKQLVLLIKKLQDRLDREAQMERAWNNKVAEIQSDYSNRYHELLKQFPHSHRMIKRYNTDFIKGAQRLWDEELKKSDPEAAYSNPYVRYDEKGRLLESPPELQEAFENYKLKVRELFEPIQVKFSEACELTHPVAAPAANKQALSQNVLCEVHTALIYALYREPLNDEVLSQESYTIRTRLMEKLDFWAKISGQSALFLKRQKELLIINEENQCQPLIKTIVAQEVSEESLKWIIFLNIALQKINDSDDFPLLLTRSETDPKIIKETLSLFLSPGHLENVNNAQDLAILSERLMQEEKEYLKLTGELVKQLAHYSETHKSILFDNIKQFLDSISLEESVRSQIMVHAKEQLENKKVSYDEYSQFYEFLLKICESDSLSLIDFILQRLSDTPLQKLSQYSQVIQNAKQQGLLRKEWLLPAFKLLLNEDNAKYEKLLQLSRFQQLEFGAMAPVIGELPLEVLTQITLWCEGNHSCDVLNSLIKRYLIEPFKPDEFKTVCSLWMELTDSGLLEPEAWLQASDSLSYPALRLIKDCIDEDYPADLLNQLIKYYFQHPAREDAFIRQLQNKELFFSMQRIIKEGKSALTDALAAYLTADAFEPMDKSVDAFLLSMVQQYVITRLTPLDETLAKKDKVILESLRGFISDLQAKKESVKETTSFNDCVLRAMQVAGKHLQSSKWNQNFFELQDSLLTLSSCFKSTSDAAKTAQNEFRVMLWQLNELLDNACKRINSRSVLLHPYKQVKLNRIKTFKESYCTETAIAQFLERHAAETSSNELLKKFIEQPVQLRGKKFNLNAILSLNTRWGLSFHTRARTDLNRLLKRFKKEFISQASPANLVDSSIKRADYANSLREIQDGLQRRARNANGFFKDKKSYQTKQEALQAYVSMFDATVHSDREVVKEVRLFDQCVRNDALINQNTARFSRFFNVKKNSTMTEIHELNKQFLKNNA